MKAEIIKTVLNCDNITDWTLSSGGVVLTAESGQYEGDACLKMVLTVHTQYVEYSFSPPLDLSPYTDLLLAVKTTVDPSENPYIFLFTDALNYQGSAINTWDYRNWEIAIYPLTGFAYSGSGTLDLSSISKIRITTPDSTPDYYFDFIHYYKDVASKIANCIIWSPMYQGSRTPRPFGYPRSMPYVNWDKRYQFCLIRVGKSNESYFQEKDIIHIKDDSDNTAFYGRMATKQDRLTSYLLWYYSWGDELMESVFPNAYSAKRSDEILIGQINASSKSTQSTSIDQTTITYTYNVAKPNREIVDLIRYLERGVFWRVPGYDGKCYFDKDITDVNILPDSGETWTESTAGINYLGKMSYAFGITRAHVWGTNNSKEQVNKKSAITAEEQETGVVGIFPFIDTALTNYTEVNQLATALKNIYSKTTWFINWRVHGKGFLQWCHRVNAQWDVDGKLPTADDYMILEWIYDAKNDVYLRFILTNNTVFEREFINVQKQLGKDVYISSEYIDVNQPESTADGTVIPGARHDKFIWLVPEPGDYHFEEGGGNTDFSTIGDVVSTYYDLDLSSIVPVGTTSVLGFISIQDGQSGSIIGFRKNGQTGGIQRAMITTQKIDLAIPGIVIVGVDSDRKCEFICNPKASDFTSIRLTIAGYWI